MLDDRCRRRTQARAVIAENDRTWVHSRGVTSSARSIPEAAIDAALGWTSNYIHAYNFYLLHYCYFNSDSTAICNIVQNIYFSPSPKSDGPHKYICTSIPGSAQPRTISPSGAAAAGSVAICTNSAPRRIVQSHSLHPNSPQFSCLFLQAPARERQPGWVLPSADGVTR